MLYQIPQNTQKTMRAVVLKHPNSMDVAIYRKVVKRKDLDPDSMLGGLPTLGGMGVLDSEDEDDFDMMPIGDARMLPCEAFQPSSVVDRGDGVDGADGVWAYAMIEPLAAPDDPEHFELKTHDFVFVVVWEGTYVGYEVVGREANINIPPFVARYVLNKRDDLQFLGGKPDYPTGM